MKACPRLNWLVLAIVAHFCQAAESVRAFPPRAHGGSNMIFYGTKLKFSMHMGGLSDCFESSSFPQNDLWWKIKFCKPTDFKDDNKTMNLNISLMSVFDESSTKLLCEARAVFRLVPMDGKSEIIAKQVKHLFSVAAPIHGIELIDWDTFLRSYVIDNKFSVEVEVLVGPKRTEFDMNNILTKFRVVVNNVSDLNIFFSPIVHMQGVDWNIQIERRRGSVAIYLNQVSSELDLNEWYWNVTFSFELISIDKNATPINYKHTDLCKYGRTWGFKDILKWSDFLQSFVTYNKAVFEIELKVESPIPLWEIDEQPSETMNCEATATERNIENALKLRESK